jgi:hypothetical protein
VTVKVLLSGTLVPAVTKPEGVPTIMVAPTGRAGSTLTKLYEILFVLKGSLGMIQSSVNKS